MNRPPPFPFDPHVNGRREQVFASDQHPEVPPLVIPPDPWDGFAAPIRGLVAWLSWCVWLVFFLTVLLPVGAVGYGVGAVMRTVRESWRKGWQDHETEDEE